MINVFDIENENAACKRLMMYLIQCRDVEFVATFEEATDCYDCPCFRGLHLYVYAMKLLLEEDGWNEEYTPIVAKARDSNSKIWDYLKQKKLVPKGYRKRLIKVAKEFSGMFPSSYEDSFGFPLEQLIEWGAKKLDCDLYMAVERLDFKEAKRLLDLGANPDGNIKIIEMEDFDEIWSAGGLAYERWDDTYTLCTDLLGIWKQGYASIDIEVQERDIIQVLISAAYKLMYDLLERYTKE
jgi:hypothetical protein